MSIFSKLFNRNKVKEEFVDDNNYEDDITEDNNTSNADYTETNNNNNINDEYFAQDPYTPYINLKKAEFNQKLAENKAHFVNTVDEFNQNTNNYLHNINIDINNFAHITTNEFMVPRAHMNELIIRINNNINSTYSEFDKKKNICDQQIVLIKAIASQFNTDIANHFSELSSSYNTNNDAYYDFNEMIKDDIEYYNNKNKELENEVKDGENNLRNLIKETGFTRYRRV